MNLIASQGRGAPAWASECPIVRVTYDDDGEDCAGFDDAGRQALAEGLMTGEKA